MKDFRVIDCHSHFGIDAFYPIEADLNLYVKKMKSLGITECFAMSAPCPIIKNKNKLIKLCIFKLNANGKISEYFKITIKNGKESRILLKNKRDPYKKANLLLYKQIKRRKDFKFYFVPILHPVFYCPKMLKKYIKLGAVAFKIHGFACGIKPDIINKDFFRLIEKLNIPLIIHTDPENLKEAGPFNSSMNWIHVLSNYNIKAMFAHGGRLNKEFIKIINNSDKYVVGLAPDKLISYTKRLDVDVYNYIKAFFSSFNSDKIVFDIDYPWNINNTKQYNLDWKFINRINEINLSKQNLIKYFSENAIHFFNLNYKS